MADTTASSDAILRDAKRSLQIQREGGYHRAGGSIGRGSAKAKQSHLLKKIRNIVIALFAIWVATGVIGLVINGIGFAGIMALAVASIVAVAVLGNYPKIKVPNRADLNKGDVRQMVARTELWLESQAPALPPPAAAVVSDMGVQLDALGLQLETVDQNHPAAREVRKLVGEHLPEMIDSYRRIPASMLGEKRGGRTPDEQLTDGLSKISSEIDSVTRQLANGALDDLAIKQRYLDYRYGDGSVPLIEDKSEGQA